MFAQEPPPGATCTKETQGTLWPIEANKDRQMARRLIQSGELYMCSAKTRKHKWLLLGINIATLQHQKPAQADDNTYGPPPRVRLARR